MTEPLVIGGACGYWGDAPQATAQLIAHPGLEVLIYDYLAEITMSLLARARAKDAAMGYAPDFISAAMRPNLTSIAARGIKVISNAGGLNPVACAEALRAEIAKQGLDLKVGVVTGDDLIARAAEFADAREMFTDDAFPADKMIASVNAYLGAHPIAAALDGGADIVITGRCADSALVLGAAIYHFGWPADAFDLMAAGSLAGHILECGPQATGGNFTDWTQAGDIADIGYPIAILQPDGQFTVTKPEGTSGVTSAAAVTEQMLYEIGDPRAYLLPDVACDFSEVQIEDHGDGVRVSGARGRAPNNRLKVSATYVDGFRAGYVFAFNGRDAGAKARAFAEAGLKRAREALRARNAPDFSDICIETIGGRTGETAYEEVMLKTAVRHEDAKAVGLFLKETMGAGLATPPGLHGFTGAGRPKPSPVVRLFSMLVDPADVPVHVQVEGTAIECAPLQTRASTDTPVPHVPPEALGDDLIAVPLETIAYARSGDKGDKANIGVIARHPDDLPWIWAGLTDAAIRAAIPFAKGAIERFYLPGTHSMNILCHDALGGGGVTSLLNDAQGKGYGQRLLAVDIMMPRPSATKRGI